MEKQKKLQRYMAKLHLDGATLRDKTVALTGSTGGIGRELCRYLLALNARLILIDRNPSRAQSLRQLLIGEYPHAEVTLLTADLSDMTSVREVTDRLIQLSPDIFIHNAGAYSIPRKICDTGYDNVYQINFVSPYYMIRELLPSLKARRGRVVVVGSIAHNYSKTDPESIDFADRKQASKVYGNAKRYLMFSMYELFSGETDVSVSVTHPGITFTGITAHYPKLIFALIKHPMKIIFMKPRKACLSILKGVFEPCSECEWIGPRFFGVWGLPAKTRLQTVSPEEQRFIGEAAQSIYLRLTR
ncbi:MAG: SDR family NAD(P)-dependent oxidoreductase [Clostridia bacterium]|nr:SDR family NAD(P)-dependent oxidoreductase [Clostridia bacterium]MBQ7315826.1 SDR family NAD(P)-dependent oxidoreductase [Clostridia bacterium]